MILMPHHLHASRSVTRLGTSGERLFRMLEVVAAPVPGVRKLLLQPKQFVTAKWRDAGRSSKEMMTLGSEPARVGAAIPGAYRSRKITDMRTGERRVPAVRSATRRNLPDPEAQEPDTRRSRRGSAGLGHLPRRDVHRRRPPRWPGYPKRRPDRSTTWMCGPLPRHFAQRAGEVDLRAQ